MKEEITHLGGLDDCPLHTNKPYGYTHVSHGQMSIARHYGCMKVNGESYTYFADSDELVRDDVLKWQKKQAKNEKA